MATLGRPYAIDYRHVDGKDYRHEFGRGAHLVAKSDGVVELRSTRGRAWDSFLQLDGTRKPYLVNPLHATVSGKLHAKRGNAIMASKKRTTQKARGVPAWVRARGFTTWAGYFDSIRGGKKRMTTKRPKAKRGGGRRRSAGAAHASPAEHHKRRRRRRSGGFSVNPLGIKIGGGKGIVGRVVKLGVGGVRDGVAGSVSLLGARLVRGRLLNLEGNTLSGVAAELSIGLLQAVIAERIFGENVGRAVMQGVTQPVIMTVAKGAGIPVVSPAFGDEGELPLLGGIYDLGGVYELSGDELPLLTGGSVGDRDAITVGADSELM